MLQKKIYLLKIIKIELWVLFLTVILFFLLLMSFGALVGHKLEAPKNRFPIMSEVAYFIAEIPSNFIEILQNKKAKELQVEDRFPNLSGFEGNPLQEEAYLLLSRYNGDIKQSIVELVDLRSFEVKKTWRPDIDKINELVDTTIPDFKNLLRDKYSSRYNIIHPFLTEDGGLIFQNESPLVKIDADSQLVWQNQTDIFHHSIEQDHQGNLWVPTSLYPYQADKKYLGSKIGYKDDAITKVSLDGKILFQKSVIELFIENNLEYLLFPMIDVHPKDILHLNDIQPVLSDGPHWKRGDVFISLRGVSMIILYRPSTNEIIWRKAGLSAAQHDVDILDDHRISIFNNNSYLLHDGRKVDGNNEIIIYNFNSDSSSKYFDESLIQYDLRTINQGLNQIFDNGELFIEEQNYGRLLYFNKNATINWQYINRANNGNVYGLNWSRMLSGSKDIKKVHKVLNIED